jgi:outer membrane immunogenic protein
MLYVTGGAAFGEVEWNATTTNAVTQTFFGTANGTTRTFASGTSTVTHAGWTVGGGSEWVLSGPWTAKLEYLFVDLGTIGNTFAGGSGIVPNVIATSHVRDSIIRIGLNYRFGGPVVANY